MKILLKPAFIIFSLLLPIFLLGCTSTSIKTPRFDREALKSATSQDLFFSSTTKPSAEDPLPHRALLQKSFDDVFAKKARDAGYRSISKNYHSSLPDRPVVNISLDKQDHVNVPSVLCCIFSLGIIPGYQTTDYLVSCSYNANGHQQVFSFQESTTTLTGWLMMFMEDAAPSPQAYNGKERVVFENISTYVLNKYSEDSAVPQK